MAAISGTNVAAKIVPFTTDDKFATHVSTYGQGGWHEVATDTERDAIPTDRRIAGMAVYVTGTKKLYILGTDLTTWTELESGKVDDVQVNGTSVVTNKVANITVPSVVDNLTSTSTTDALSANQGRALQSEIESLQGLGRFLSTWNCATGLAGTNPPTSPYTYHSGDYFIVGTVSAADPAVNYKPNGSSYTTGTPSTTVETEVVAINDVYIYDGTNWKLQINSQRDVTFASIAGEPTDNTNLAAALNAKADASALTAHTSDTNNPHSVTKAQVGLGNVDNTSDLNKPISTATQTALNAKQDTLTAGTGINIDPNTNIISSTTAESNFRGRFANYTSVPTTAGGYAPDYRGIRTPSNNDYMVVSDSSDYAQTTSFVSDATYINYNIDGYRGTLKISDIPSGRINIGEFNQFSIRNGGDRIYVYCNVENTYKTSPTATTYIAGGGVGCINEAISTSWSKSFYRDSGSYQGAWRFRYIGMWSTDGKSGWLPEYQVEDTLPIATDTEPGIMKLYTTTGSNTDGTMDQNSITNELGKRLLQVTEMPEATSENEGQIVQWKGVTGTYANGYFYQCVLITIPSSATITPSEGSGITDLEINLEDFESYVQPESDMTLVFTYNGENWDLPDELDVALIDYGISYSGEPVQNDTITVVYTAESSTYGWVEKLVQHGITITYNAETEELTIS